MWSQRGPPPYGRHGGKYTRTAPSIVVEWAGGWRVRSFGGLPSQRASCLAYRSARHSLPHARNETHGVRTR